MIYLQVDDWEHEKSIFGRRASSQGVSSTVLLQWAQAIEQDVTWLLGDFFRPQHKLSLSAYIFE